MAIEEFISGHWYVYKSTTEDIDNYTLINEMKFIIDGKPHQCNEGSGDMASFYDCEHYNTCWIWTLQMNDFYDISDEIKRDKLKKFLEV